MWKKHPCQECEKQFTLKSSLTTHQKSTHIGIQYPNDECEYKQRGNRIWLVIKQCIWGENTHARDADSSLP